jgi:hypothetical protein
MDMSDMSHLRSVGIGLHSGHTVIHNDSMKIMHDLEIATIAVRRK